MAEATELLQAARSEATLLVLFIPSADRDGEPLGKKEQKRWTRKALRLLGEGLRGATAFPRGWGVWRDGGPFGMARLAHLMHQRLTPSQGERPGRPTDSTWASRPKVPMSEATQRWLAEIAEEISTPQRRVSPMQVAAQLLEEAVNRVRA